MYILAKALAGDEDMAPRSVKHQTTRTFARQESGGIEGEAAQGMINKRRR
jgi:hypothetical protein